MYLNSSHKLAWIWRYSYRKNWDLSSFKELPKASFLPSPNYFSKIGFAHCQKFTFGRFVAFMRIMKL